MTVAGEAVGKRAPCGKCKKVFRIEAPARADAVAAEQEKEEAAPPRPSRSGRGGRSPAKAKTGSGARSRQSRGSTGLLDKNRRAPK
jgi:hypothetical protein